jgi:hypothetical protein
LFRGDGKRWESNSVVGWDRRRERGNIEEDRKKKTKMQKGKITKVVRGGGLVQRGRYV